MTMTNSDVQLSIFDDLDAEILKEKAEIELAELKQRETNSQPHQCYHCGEWSPNKYLLAINHGRVFNGWCGKRLLLNRQAHSEAVEWLSSHGWVQCDEHDQTNWADDADLYWERNQ